MRIPKLRHHQGRGEGLVRLNGRDVYCGVWPADREKPPPEVEKKYKQVIAEWIARDCKPELPARDAPDEALPLTVREMVVRYLDLAREQYSKNGKPTAQYKEFVYACRPLNFLAGDEPARNLTPLKLKAVRDLMVTGYDHPRYGPQTELSRGTVNARCQRIVRIYRWAVSEELVDVAVLQALQTVAALKRNRTPAAESKRVEPVAWEVVERTLPHLTNHLQGAVRFQFHSGVRPTEALEVNLAEIDRSGPLWIYRKEKHKTEHHGHKKRVFLGPRAQTVLLEFIHIQCPLCRTQGRPPRIGSRDLAICGRCADQMDEKGVCGPWQRCEVQARESYLFDPRQSVEEYAQDRRSRRKTKVSPSQMKRGQKRKRKSPPLEKYKRDAYSHAIARVCERKGIPHWHPHQLRHAAGTLVRSRFGLEGAQAALGQSTLQATQIYAEKSEELARRVAWEMG